MGDWIKLPSGKYFNLDALLAVIPWDKQREETFVTIVTAVGNRDDINATDGAAIRQAMEERANK